jgi:hypothetical protein
MLGPLTLTCPQNTQWPLIDDNITEESRKFPDEKCGLEGPTAMPAALPARFECRLSTAIEFFPPWAAYRAIIRNQVLLLISALAFAQQALVTCGENAKMFLLVTGSEAKEALLNVKCTHTETGIEGADSCLR